jgi:hypothetical protein
MKKKFPKFGPVFSYELFANDLYLNFYKSHKCDWLTKSLSK